MNNRFFPPITDEHYGLALAMRNYLSSYDYIVSQPSVLGPQASERFLEVMRKPSVPLTDPPIPFKPVSDAPKEET